MVADGLLDAGDVCGTRWKFPTPWPRRASGSRPPGPAAGLGGAHLADPTVRAMLELPGGVWFRRATALSIARTTDEDEVRLRHVAARAIENWHGRAFADPDAAMDHAEHKFGVARLAWQPPFAGGP